MVAIPTERRRTRPRLHIVPATGVPARVRVDALPEHTEYRDTGCDVSPSCLRCPLARCKYDEPPLSAQRLSAAQRDREIVLLRTKYGAPIELLASTYGVTPRTVFRALSGAKRGSGARQRRRAVAAPASTTAAPIAPSATATSGRIAR
jgi:hypothetical protein